MSDKRPVVVYGVSGYTGRLVCEYLREYNVPFIAAGRDKAKVQAVVDKIPGIETADYEVVGVEHTVEALTELFKGARFVSNMVGPFIKYGSEVVEACLAAGCHYSDTTGEQDWVMHAEKTWGDAFKKKGLLLAPNIAQMYTTGEIAANICLETPGLDTLDILVFWKGLPTYASTLTVLARPPMPKAMPWAAPHSPMRVPSLCWRPLATMAIIELMAAIANVPLAMPRTNTAACSGKSIPNAVAAARA